MRIRIGKSNLEWSRALAAYVERRLQQRLRRLSGWVRDIEVTLADVNGPRGGADKRCVVTATMPTGQDVVIRSVDHCPYRAVDDAALRLRHTIDRARTRTHDRRRPRRG